MKKSFKKKIVVLGCNDVSKQLIDILNRGFKKVTVAGFFEDADNSSLLFPIPKLGSIRETIAYARNNRVSEIYCTLPAEKHHHIYALARESESHFIRFRYVPEMNLYLERKTHLNFSSNTPTLSYRQEPLENPGNRFYKRTFDVIFSLAVIALILSWLVPIIAIIIKLDSPGPIFFTQLRSGKNNKQFLCFKFRSLKVNQQANDIQVTKTDKRFTSFGKFLRKSNLDELPQFFNVAFGHMSVVGPRPHMLKHTQEFSSILDNYMLRHYIKPGVTGWAQVNGYRGEIKAHEDLIKRVDHDIWYMENWSIPLELKIIFLTVFNTIKGDANAF